MNTVQSKYHNPDKYIERLKEDVKFLERVRENQSKEHAKAYGNLLFDGHERIGAISFCLTKHAEVRPRQNVAIECIVDTVGINNSAWDNVNLIVKAIRVRDKEGI